MTIGRVLIEAHDKWQVSDRRDLSKAPMALPTQRAPTVLQPRRDVVSE